MLHIGGVASLTINLRVLLWQKSKHRKDGADRLEAWSKLLQSETSISLKRAKELVLGEVPTQEEIKLISQGLSIEEPTLVNGDLLTELKINILQENLRFLLGGLEHGQQKTLGIDRSTVGRWLKGEVHPRPSTLDQLIKDLGLAPKMNLNNDPLFLQVEPINASEARQWLKNQIDVVDSYYLLEIYPALRRLLESS